MCRWSNHLILMLIRENKTFKCVPRNYAHIIARSGFWKCSETPACANLTADSWKWRIHFLSKMYISYPRLTGFNNVEYLNAYHCNAVIVMEDTSTFFVPEVLGCKVGKGVSFSCLFLIACHERWVRIIIEISHPAKTCGGHVVMTTGWH